MATQTKKGKGKKSGKKVRKPKRKTNVNASVAGESAPRAKKTKNPSDKSKRVSALDAAAQVLKSAGKPMRAKELIDAMAEQGLWKSPGGATPHATLYAAMLREAREKGSESRFRRLDRGMFTINA